MSQDWQRLDRRTVWVTAGVMAGIAVAAGVPTAAGFLRGNAPTGVVLAFVLPGAALLIAGGMVADYVRWRHTGYRITATQVELRSDFVQRKHRAVHRDRIRTVDLTANPLHRIFGVAKVSIGTGEQADSRGGQLVLDPLDRSHAEALRQELLHRSAPQTDPKTNGALATIDWRWIRYAPISVWPGILGVAATGALWQVTDWFGLEDTLINRLGDLVREQSLLVVIPLGVLVVLAVGLVATLGFFVESWWTYRLEREPGGTLRLHRGLVIHRSLSLAEDRLRGIELVEPFGARQVGAARLEAVATGLARRKPDEKQVASKVLLPESPRAHADTVAAAILDEPGSPTSAPLRAHPPAARAKRLRWALASVAAVVLVLVVLGLALTPVLLHVAWVAAIVLGAFAVFLALEMYRNLGHGDTGDYLVIRHGALARRTVALRRNGVIGWTVRQTPFQRRAGLISVTATTAAGGGAYTMYDADAAEGLEFAEAMVPGLLGPFLEG